MDISGNIRMIGETKAFGANGFRKREMVVTTDEQYPQNILIEFTQDKCDLLNLYRLGEAVKVGINLRGNEWINPQGETKYFNAIQGWKIERTGQQQSNNQGSAVNNYQSQQQPATQQPDYKQEEHDDLPF